MINLWNYQTGDKIQLIDSEGKKYIGRVVAVFDAEETYDAEDSITIDVEGQYYGFFPSEISRIERL